MKKTVSLMLSGVMAGTLVTGAAACAEKVDYEATAFDAPEATVTAFTYGDTKEISDRLFGVFLEDINFASYALDDNMVVNNSFESTQGVKKTYGWDVTNAEFTVENKEGVLSSVEGYRSAHVNENYAKLVTKAGATLVNSGYAAVPMAVKKGTQYVFTAFVKAPDSGVKMTVTVEDDKGNSYLSEDVQITQDPGWVKYTRKIKATDTANSDLSLVLSFDSTATVYLDAVTLETTESTIGIKQYMYDAIANLSPKFIRFPGGCVIEGNGYFNADGETSLDDAAYDWKNSIGAAVTGDGDDIVPAFRYKLNEKNGSTKESGETYGETSTRKPNRDLWGGTNLNTYYDMEYNIGFYEYFLLCDRLGASAVPILNCGYSCQGGAASNARLLKGRHGNGVKDYIQDALDLVAFAKGNPASSDRNEVYWAGIRKAMGHEAPFEMTYLGIGNEQWGDTYYNCYKQFVEAFGQAKKDNPALYGDIQLIVGNGPSIADCEGYNNGDGTARKQALSYRGEGKIEKLSEFGVHDHHYYRNYTEFYELSTFYDGYSREEADRYDVFVGEYSANESVRYDTTSFRQKNNSWLTALSEAAYMTGLERNGDIVKLAAYAPMFASLDHPNHWGADMMFYTNTQLVLTPNYYVQQLFMKNTGSLVLESDVMYAKDFESSYTISGMKPVTVDKLYQVVGRDEGTGDIIVKIVNSYEEDISVNVSLKLGSSVKLTGVADVTVLQNSERDVTSDEFESAVTPRASKIGIGETFGYTAEKYSVTVIRVHTK